MIMSQPAALVSPDVSLALRSTTAQRSVLTGDVEVTEP